MVYRGPSGGCQTCRKRRVKCDETRPACNNCTRRRVACPGYSSTLRPGEKFIDETRAVVRASQKAQETRVLRGLPEQEIFASICFFFNNYALVDKGIQSTRSELLFMPQLYSKAKPESAVSASMDALALTFRAMWSGNEPATLKSQHHANRAIIHLQNELRDPTQMKSDELLFAITMLQFRETIVGTNKLRQAQDKHQQGAHAVIEHRGKQTIESDIYKRLVHSLRGSILSDSLQNCQRIDRSLAVWTVIEGMPEQPDNILSVIGIDVANLQVDLQELITAVTAEGKTPADLTLDQQKEVERLKQESARVEQDVMAWEHALPVSWRPVTIPPAEIPSAIRNAGLYMDLCHVYPSISISGAWQTYRLLRLILLRIMITCDRIPGIQPVASDVPEWLPTVESMLLTLNLQQNVDDLCASVPFHLGSRNDTASIEEFNDTSSLDFPWPSPDQNPWKDIGHLSAAGRKREALALGGWHLLGPISATLKILATSMSICPDRPPAPEEMLGSLVREGQMGWMLEQLQRTLVVQKMIPKGAPLPQMQ